MTAFAARYGSEADHIAYAPGRVNLLGEHTDYTGGLVLPIAINRWTLTAAGATSTRESRIRAEDLDSEYGFDLTRPIRPVRNEEVRFANHVLGILESLRAMGPSEEQLNILISSNVPIGAGVSSSAALEVATVRACELFFDVHLDNLAAAKIAQRTEHEFVGTPCGIMDMLVSATAEQNHALLINCSKLESTSIALPSEEKMGILVVNTGTKHDLATSAYAERRASCERIQEVCQLPLSQIDLDVLLNAELDNVDKRRGTHVIEENARVLEAVEALRNEDLPHFGECLFQGHSSLKNLFEVTTPELDLIVETASGLRDRGVYGARMTGGGFGGSAIIVHTPESVDVIRDEISKAFSAAFDKRPVMFSVQAVSGAARIQ